MKDPVLKAKVAATSNFWQLNIKIPRANLLNIKINFTCREIEFRIHGNESRLNQIEN